VSCLFIFLNLFMNFRVQTISKSVYLKHITSGCFKQIWGKFRFLPLYKYNIDLGISAYNPISCQLPLVCQ